jgi:polyisoprenoid-binding protein YceI
MKLLQSRTNRFHSWFISVLAAAAIWCSLHELRGDPGYTAKSGKIEFTVGSNLPMVTVKGSSSAVTGGGEATVHENSATIRNLHFEVDPKTFKTGLSLRDSHMCEKVFATSSGVMPKIVLKAGSFEAKMNPQTQKWEGAFRAQVTMRGVTRPVSFRATAEKKGDSALVRAEGTVRISEFGVETISYSGAAVDDEVAVVVKDLLVGP